MNRAVFIDRDGVINGAVLREGRPYPPASLEDFIFLPRVDEAVSDLRRAGFKVIIVTNQPDVGLGLQSKATVEAMHQRITKELHVDGIKVCYHTEQDHCACRKPKPGMLIEAALEWNLDLALSFMVGDRWRDVGAGKAAGCRTIWISNNYAERQPENPDIVADSLWQASRRIIKIEGA